MEGFETDVGEMVKCRVRAELETQPFPAFMGLRTSTGAYWQFVNLKTPRQMRDMAAMLIVVAEDLLENAEDEELDEKGGGK